MSWIQFGLLLSGINLVAFNILIKSKSSLAVNAILWLVFSILITIFN